MEIKTEADIRNYLVNKVKYLKMSSENPFLIHFIPIETRTKSGIPDIYYYVNSHVKNLVANGWIELKIGKKSRDNVVIKYQPGQQIWIKEHNKNGLRAFVLVYYNYQFYLFNDAPRSITPYSEFSEQAIFYNKDLSSLWFIDELIR